MIATDSAVSLHGPVQGARMVQAPPVAASIDIPVLDEAWGDALNERVLWMAGKSIQKAEIRLNPAELGPIRIEVLIRDDSAKVSFSAQNAVTREAIESAMPRLREMLSESGISLANTDVSDSGGSHEQHAGENDALHGPSADIGGLEENEVAISTAVDSRSTSALVDTFV
jgi:flagellar hook-length control protein FliK